MRGFLEEANRATLDSYAIKPAYLREHHGIEQTVLAGGYGYRQILELVQNGADAILEGQQEGKSTPGESRIHVLVRDRRLYVANTGAPLGRDGLEALLGSHSSPKRGNQIGRFGLGFKSLLRLEGRVELFGRNSVDVRFDPSRCREELKRRFGVPEAPGLRLAWPLEPSERAEDEIVAGLDWAETVVRAEISSTDLLEHLKREVVGFPAEFLLFFPVATTLILDDGESPPREVRVEREGDIQVLHDSGEASRWRVLSREATISDPKARADATHIHARERVPLAWALPFDGRREESGLFWAFFPTHTPTYVPGILNAPWKLNSDRNAVIGGEWNTALMVEAAGLVVDNLAGLATAEDPGRPLDAFPRQLLRKDEVAAPLVQAIWAGVEKAAVIADGCGELRKAAGLWRHPVDSPQVVSRWQSLAGEDERRALVHESCMAGQRASRLGVLASRLEGRGAPGFSAEGNLQKINDERWFRLIASTETSRALDALRLAEAYSEECPSGVWEAARTKIAIIPVEDGSLGSAAEVVLAPRGVTVPGRSVVAADLSEMAEARRLLIEVMEVRELDDSVWFSVLREALRRALEQGTARSALWGHFWKTLRLAPEGVCRSFLEKWRGQVRVRRKDFVWAKASEALLPGALVGVEESAENQRVLIDPELHAEDSVRLSHLGVREFPDGFIVIGNAAIEGLSSALAGETELEDWLAKCRSTYTRTHRNSASWGYLEPAGFAMPAGYGLLRLLSGRANAMLTDRYLSLLCSTEIPRELDFGHATVKRYPRILVRHPLRPWLARHGSVMLGRLVVPLAALLARRDEPALREVAGGEALLQKLEGSELGPQEVELSSCDFETFWRALIEALASPEPLADGSLAPMLARAAQDGVVPPSIRIEGVDLPISRFLVTTSPDLGRRLHQRGRLVVTLEGPTLDLWREAGAVDLNSALRAEWASVEGPTMPVVEALPELQPVLLEETAAKGRCQPVSGLKLSHTELSEAAPCLMWDGALLVDNAQLAALSMAERLIRVVREVHAAGWLNCSLEAALEKLWDAKVEERRQQVADGLSLAERLVRAVGGRREPLLEVLGGVGGLDVVEQCSLPDLASLTIAQLGPTTLLKLKDTLEAEGLGPPARWNSPESRTFVTGIGFPVEFGAGEAARRDPELFVSGPIDLPPLHDFQEEVLEGIRSLVTASAFRRRAVVSLPTGGGKTRVTVEAAVRLVLAPEGNRRSVVWVAQTDELCEQAVQAFRQVWVNLGAEGTELRIVRLWGGNPSPIIQTGTKPVVVVASIQTLNSRMGSLALDWLKEPGLVVVDECHHAITPSYTNLLRWLDAEAPRREGAQREEPPILGLSATPFRMDDEESDRLAKRFDRTWFPADQEALHVRLLRQGVLAKAEPVALETGVPLSDEEIRRLDSLPEPWEGFDFERILEEINQRLARNPKRNEQLVECIQSSAERSILLFSNSVQHAEEMSARLNLAGIPAAAVSGGTPMVARRYFLDGFKRGEIRALCNHSVLTTGFDAPKTDMILIARQVFSPVRYMQMVGRGLRGEKNGGTPSCRVVSVLDNLGRFQNRHPYHYCREYFAGQRPGALAQA